MLSSDDLSSEHNIILSFINNKLHRKANRVNFITRFDSAGIMFSIFSTITQYVQALYVHIYIAQSDLLTRKSLHHLMKKSFGSLICLPFDVSLKVS